MNRRKFIRTSSVLIGSLALGGLETSLFSQTEAEKRLANFKKKLINDKEIKAAGITEELITRLFENKQFQEYTAIEYFFKNNIEKSTDSTGKKETDPEKKKQMQEAAYQRYKKHLGIEQKKLEAVKFYSKYEEHLIKAEKTHGLDRRYNIATLAIETDFGENKGLVTKKGTVYKAFNTLASIYTYVRTPMYVSVWKEQEDGTRTVELVKKEWGDDFALPHMKYLLLFAQRQKKLSGKNITDVLFMPSSYAGCSGNEQFTGESLYKYGIGRKGDFSTDPFDLTDSIYNVAYYFKNKGWKSEWNHINHLKKPEMLKKVKSVVRRYNTSVNYGRAIVDIANNTSWPLKLEDLILRINFKN